jgi:hypothetical protein
VSGVYVNCLLRVYTETLLGNAAGESCCDWMEGEGGGDRLEVVVLLSLSLFSRMRPG